MSFELASETDQDDKPSGCKEKCLKIFKDNLFMLLILLGVAVGFGLGFGLRAATDSPIAQQWISESFILVFISGIWMEILIDKTTLKYSNHKM